MPSRTTTPAAEGQSGKTPRRRAAKAKGDDSKKASVRISGLLDFRLHVIATANGLSKEKMALKLIEQGVDRYEMDKESQSLYAKIRAKAGEAA